MKCTEEDYEWYALIPHPPPCIGSSPSDCKASPLHFVYTELTFRSTTSNIRSCHTPTSAFLVSVLSNANFPNWLKYDIGIKFRARALVTLPDSTSQWLLLRQLARKDQTKDIGRVAIIQLNFSGMRKRRCVEVTLKNGCAHSYDRVLDGPQGSFHPFYCVSF